MRALVTGGAGFIGSTLVDALLARGDKVTIVDDLSSGSRENLTAATGAGADLRVADVRDTDATRAAADGCEVIYHLAAHIDLRRALDEPAFDASVNVLGTISVLEAAREHGARVVLASSAAVYGEPSELPLPEEAVLRPATPYGQGKLAAEGYADLYGRAHGIAVLSLRFANVYGRRQDPRGETGVVAIFCDTLRSGQGVTIFGDGAQTRDFVHVDDSVQAMIIGAGSSATGPLNAGTGIETSVLELASVLAGLLGVSAEPKISPERNGGVRRIGLDSARAEEAIGWRAEIDLRAGLEQTLSGPGGQARAG